MRPWGKRGFLHWLFFQNPKKKPSGASRRAHSPKLLTTESQKDSGSYDDWPDPVVAYPMPYGEGVLEANIIDFVESDYQVENVFTRRDGKHDETIIDGDSTEATTTWDEILADITSYGTLEDTPDSTAAENVPEDNGHEVTDEPEDRSVVPEDEPQDDGHKTAEVSENGDIPEEPPSGQPQDDSGQNNDEEPKIDLTEYDYAVKPPGESEKTFEPESTEPDPSTYEHHDEPIATDTPPPSTANTCAECGAPFGDTDIFCGRCGTRLAGSIPIAVKAFCGQCGAKNEHKLKFCGDCGFKLAYQNVAPPL